MEGGSCQRGNFASPQELPSLAGRSAGTDGKLQGLRGECSNWAPAGRTERPAQRVLPTSLGSPVQDMHPLVCMGAECWKLGLQWTDLGKGLGFAAQRQSEGTGVCFELQSEAEQDRPGVCHRSHIANGCKERWGPAQQPCSQHVLSRHSPTSVGSGSVQAPADCPHTKVGLKSEPILGRKPPLPRPLTTSEAWLKSESSPTGSATPWIYTLPMAL